MYDWETHVVDEIEDEDDTSCSEGQLITGACSQCWNLKDCHVTDIDRMFGE